jgi:hypothetical protein
MRRASHPAIAVSFRNHFEGIQDVPGSNYLVMSGSKIHASMGSLFVIRMDDQAAVVSTTDPY